MKNNKVIKITLYVCSLLALVYTGFTLFSTYESVTAYYEAYNAEIGAMDMITSLISNAFVPLMFAVVLYALAYIVEGVQSIYSEFEVVSTEESSNREAENAQTEPKEEEQKAENQESASEEEKAREDKEKNLEESSE